MVFHLGTLGNSNIILKWKFYIATVHCLLCYAIATVNNYFLPRAATIIASTSLWSQFSIYEHLVTVKVILKMAILYSDCLLLIAVYAIATLYIF